MTGFAFGALALFYGLLFLPALILAPYAAVFWDDPNAGGALLVALTVAWLMAPLALALALVGIVVFGLLRQETARIVAVIYPAAHGLVVFALALAA